METSGLRKKKRQTNYQETGVRGEGGESQSKIKNSDDGRRDRRAAAYGWAIGKKEPAKKGGEFRKWEKVFLRERGKKRSPRI